MSNVTMQDLNDLHSGWESECAKLKEKISYMDGVFQKIADYLGVERGDVDGLLAAIEDSDDAAIRYIDQIQELLAEIEKMKGALREIVEAEYKSSPTATDFGISWDKSYLIGTMKDIARKALAAGGAENV